MITVNTGWRDVTPGKCTYCGCDDDWCCEGDGTIFCTCQACPECGVFDGHSPGCIELMSTDEILDHVAQSKGDK